MNGNDFCPYLQVSECVLNLWIFAVMLVSQKGISSSREDFKILLKAIFTAAASTRRLRHPRRCGRHFSAARLACDSERKSTRGPWLFVAGGGWSMEPSTAISGSNAIKWVKWDNPFGELESSLLSNWSELFTLDLDPISLFFNQTTVLLSSLQMHDQTHLVHVGSVIHFSFSLDFHQSGVPWSRNPFDLWRGRSYLRSALRAGKCNDDCPQISPCWLGQRGNFVTTGGPRGQKNTDFDSQLFWLTYLVYFTSPMDPMDEWGFSTVETHPSIAMPSVPRMVPCVPLFAWMVKGFTVLLQGGTLGWPWDGGAEMEPEKMTPDEIFAGRT